MRWFLFLFFFFFGSFLLSIVCLARLLGLYLSCFLAVFGVHGQGQRVNFAITATRVGATHGETSKVYFNVPPTMKVMWDACECIIAKQWLEQERFAEEAQAGVEPPEKGNAADEPSA